MYLIPEEELKDVIAFVYGNDLCIAVKPNQEVGDDNSAVAEQKNMKDRGAEDGVHVKRVQFLRAIKRGYSYVISLF